MTRDVSTFFWAGIGFATVGIAHWALLAIVSAQGAAGVWECTSHCGPSAIAVVGLGVSGAGLLVSMYLLGPPHEVSEA